MKTSDELLDRILAEAPSPETLLLILKEKKAEGRNGLVIREGLKALSRFPGDTRIRTLLAESCLDSGWLSRAESELETATAEIEALVPLYLLKARVYSTLNRNAEAVRSLEVYLAHDPGNQEALRLLETLNRKSERPQAGKAEDQEPLEEISFTVPEIATPTLAELYLAQGQMEEAISTYEKILSRDPQAESSRTRLEELKAMLSPAPPMQGVDPDSERARKKKERMIHVLETWRESLRKQAKPEVGDQRSEVS
jgi:tetratricopeptide (TPR) repeat protein